MPGAVWDYMLVGSARELAGVVGVTEGYVQEAWRRGKRVRGLSVERRSRPADEPAKVAVAAISPGAQERLRALLGGR